MHAFLCVCHVWLCKCLCLCVLVMHGYMWPFSVHLVISHVVHWAALDLNAALNSVWVAALLKVSTNKQHQGGPLYKASPSFCSCNLQRTFPRGLIGAGIELCQLKQVSKGTSLQPFQL